MSRNFPHTVALSTHAQIWTGDVWLWLFYATCSALGPLSPLSQAVLAEEVNREVQKAEVLPKENEPNTSRSTRKSLK